MLRSLCVNIAVESHPSGPAQQEMTQFDRRFAAGLTLWLAAPSQCPERQHDSVPHCQLQLHQPGTLMSRDLRSPAGSAGGIDHASHAARSWSRQAPAWRQRKRRAHPLPPAACGLGSRHGGERRCGAVLHPLQGRGTAESAGVVPSCTRCRVGAPQGSQGRGTAGVAGSGHRRGRRVGAPQGSQERGTPRDCND